MGSKTSKALRIPVVITGLPSQITNWVLEDTGKNLVFLTNPPNVAPPINGLTVSGTYDQATQILTLTSTGNNISVTRQLSGCTFITGSAGETINCPLDADISAAIKSIATNVDPVQSYATKSETTTDISNNAIFFG